MIKLSRMADYAVVLMTQLATGDGGARNAADMACETRLPAPTVSKILKSLARAGLLRSSRGAHGGYTLAFDPRDINVVDIIAAVDGPIALTACVEDGPGDCDIEAFCPLRSHWQIINDAVRGALRQVTLADLVAPHAVFPGPRMEMTAALEVPRGHGRA